MSYQLHQAKKYCVITFPSTQYALRAESILQESAIKFIIIPTPREISASCGLSIKSFCEDNVDILNLLEINNISYEGNFEISKMSKNLVSKLETKNPN